MNFPLANVSVADSAYASDRATWTACTNTWTAPRNNTPRWIGISHKDLSAKRSATYCIYFYNIALSRTG